MMACNYYLVHLNSQRRFTKIVIHLFEFPHGHPLWRGLASPLTSLYGTDSDPMYSSLLKMNVTPVGKFVVISIQISKLLQVWPHKTSAMYSHQEVLLPGCLFSPSRFFFPPQVLPCFCSDASMAYHCTMTVRQSSTDFYVIALEIFHLYLLVFLELTCKNSA